ncbi:AAA-like domain-containing protein [Chloroflexi bacterium TSY]|nr:AAA-like domain-containing protein [Chloroflexi bacterium TSY]
MRYFNTHGPVNEQEHYVVPRDRLVDDLVTHIEQGKYFTIYAPRQMGKTTLLHKLNDRLIVHGSFIPILLNFEQFEEWSAVDFLDELSELICYQIREALSGLSHPTSANLSSLLEKNSPNNYRAFAHFFRALYRLAPEYKVVLIVDEFDATPKKTLSPLLQTWRAMYLNKEIPHSLHNVVLIGIQNIARLNFGRSSPFNIAYQHRLADFTLFEVKDLLTQYTSETEQEFEPGIVERLHEQTSGHPFLINRTAAILTEKIVPDRIQLITHDDLNCALQHLVRETNYNFETIIRHANLHRDDVLNILFGATYEFNLNDPVINELSEQGILSADSDGNCQIANSVYGKILLAAFRPRRMRLQADILINGYDYRPHLGNSKLQMSLLLSLFRQFVERRGREAFQVTPMPQEATGQYLLMAYLDLVVRSGGGDLFTEVDSGNGRLDLIAVHQGQRYVVETKVWRGQAEYDKGLMQLADYLESESVQEGYYVIFHARPNVYGKLPQKELEFQITQDGKRIHVYLVRLMLSATAPDVDADNDSEMTSA